MQPEIDAPDTVLCIPGFWPNRTSLIAEIAENSGGYLFAGGVLLDIESDRGFELQVEPHDPRLVAAYAAAGRHWVSPGDLAMLKSHTFVLYLVGQGGSPRKAEEFMLAASGLLRAGGHSVKVESTGVAHGKDKWLSLTDERHLFRAHEAFVIYVTGDQIYSCGMHNLGYADAIIDSAQSDDPVALLRVFTYYLFTENPTLSDGDTFARGTDAPRYRLSHERCSLYEADDLFTNPYGMWRLTPVPPSNSA